MTKVAVCRNLYPSWKSTARYLDSLDADLAVFPEETLTMGEKSWTIDDVAEHTSRRPTILVSGHNYGLVVVKGGLVEYQDKDPAPISFVTRNGPITSLVRICAMSLKPSPQYRDMSDLLIISSSLAFAPKVIMGKHNHNLAAGALIVMSTYELRNCWAADLTGKKFGRVNAEKYGGHIQVDLGTRV